MQIFPFSQVLQSIVVLLLIMLLGWFLAYKKWWDEKTTAQLNRFLIDLVTPLMIFTQLLSTTSFSLLKTKIHLPLYAALIYLIGILMGQIYTRLFLPQQSSTTRSTFTFLVATPNWIYFPLMIVSQIPGQTESVRTVLLGNIGFLAMIWTVGIKVLQAKDIQTENRFFYNPALWATFLAVVCIGLKASEPFSLDGGDYALPELLMKSSFRWGEMIGSLALTLSPLLTGAMIYQSPWRQTSQQEIRLIIQVLLLRLIIIPVIIYFILINIPLFFSFFTPATTHPYGLSSQEILTFCLIAAMPVAISSPTFCLKYQGDKFLASSTVLLSHVLILFSLPFFFFLLAK